ncbi:hypothetical protein SARC_14918, partial [Sphaeroforma arctica JP610]
MIAKLKEKGVFNAANEPEQEIAYSIIVQSVDDSCAVALARITTAMNRQTEANLDVLTKKLDRMCITDGKNISGLSDRLEILFGQIADQ